MRIRHIDKTYNNINHFVTLYFKVLHRYSISSLITKNYIHHAFPKLFIFNSYMCMIQRKAHISLISMGKSFVIFVVSFWISIFCAYEVNVHTSPNRTQGFVQDSVPHIVGHYCLTLKSSILRSFKADNANKT